jgi:hypothetical protein
VRTYVEQDDKGWWCVCGFWTAKAEKDVGNPGEDPTRAPDDVLRVGPWESEERAWKELRGGVRVSVMQAVKEMLEERDGKITGAEFTS